MKTGRHLETQKSDVIRIIVQFFFSFRNTARRSFRDTDQKRNLSLHAFLGQWTIQLIRVY